MSWHALRAATKKNKGGRIRSYLLKKKVLRAIRQEVDLWKMTKLAATSQASVKHGQLVQKAFASLFINKCQAEMLKHSRAVAEQRYRDRQSELLAAAFGALIENAD